MYKVLIVEDEMLVRLGLKNSVDWSKHDMLVAGDVSNGKAAWDFYKKNKPDIIITDIKMPVMDGMELISKIRAQDDKTRIVILSCLEEFELVKKAMSLGVSDYILKLTMTEDEMDTILGKIRNEMKQKERLNEGKSSGISSIDAVKDKLLKDYMFYRIYSSEEFASRIQALGLCLASGPIIAAIMEIDNYKGLKRLFEDPKGYLTNFALMNAINEILDKHAKGEVFHDEESRYILIFSVDEFVQQHDAYEIIINTLKKIKEVLSIYFNTSVSFGLSSIGNGFEFLSDMYLEAAEVLDSKFFLGSGIILKYGEKSFKEASKEKFVMLYKLYDLIGIKDEGFKAEFDKKVRLLLCSTHEKKEQVLDTLCQFLHWMIDNIHLSGDEIYALMISYGEMLRSAETLDEALEYVREFVVEVRKFFEAKNIMSNEIFKALTFVQQNYSNEISLQDVAEHVSLSPSYFSSLFKKELHVNFIEYLNDLRIEKAKELLRDTCLKSYEIAEKVGFKESTYFSMLFKKATGSSPNKFRQVWQKAWKGDAEDESN